MVREHTVPCSQEGTIQNLRKNQGDISDKLERINHTIHGNGDGIGMKTDLALVVQRTEGLQQLIEKGEQRKNHNAGLWIAGISVFLLLVFGLWDHLKESKEKTEFKEMIQEIKTLNAPVRSGFKLPKRRSELLHDSLRDDSLMKIYR